MRVSLLFILTFFTTFHLKAQSLRIDTSGLAKPKFFELAFLNDSTIEYPDAVNRFYVKQYGTITLTTGKIVLSDFEGVGKTRSFVQTFPKGVFPVEFSIGSDAGHSFLAYARIMFSKDSVARWEYAFRPTERPKALTDRTFDTCMYSETAYAMYVLLILLRTNFSGNIQKF